MANATTRYLRAARREGRGLHGWASGAAQGRRAPHVRSKGALDCSHMGELCCGGEAIAAFDRLSDMEPPGPPCRYSDPNERAASDEPPPAARGRRASPVTNSIRSIGPQPASSAIPGVETERSHREARRAGPARDDAFGIRGAARFEILERPAPNWKATTSVTRAGYTAKL